MSSRSVRAGTTLLAFGAGFLAACAMSARPPAAAAPGLTWKRNGDKLIFTPGAAGTRYLVVSSGAAGAPAQGRSPAQFSFAAGPVAVPAASQRVAAYAISPVLTCRIAQCEPCVRGTGGDPDCGYPPNPWAPGSLLSVFWP